MSTRPLLALRLDPRLPPGLQLERQVRALVAAGGLPVGTVLPSTRALAADHGVSRGVAVRAYAQLAAEGYIALRRGAAPVVVATVDEASPPPRPARDVPVAGARYNLRPDLPDLGLFPRAQWLAATRAAVQRAVDADLAYGDPLGAAELRHRIAPFLVRTRGVVATPERTAIFAGSSHALHALASTLRTRGARTMAIEDPGHRWRTRAVRAAGLEVLPVRVDDEGLCVDELPDADAVLVSPDHHFPFGVALSATRRRALAAWAREADRIVVEHDYDGHFRYDRPPAATLQALAPEHVAYVGSASALLAPTLRLGWAVLPAQLVEPLFDELFSTVIAQPRLAQLALAEFVARGYLDRHLRRARAAYRRRRALVEGRGAPAGLFVHVPLPRDGDEAAVLAAARARGIAVDGVNEHAIRPQPPGLAVGFAAAPEPTLRRALAELTSTIGA
jgi:GntR family transcriptional regulator/MocR family aminotransferase